MIKFLWLTLNDFLNHHAITDKIVTGSVGVTGTWLSIWLGVYFRYLPDLNLILSFLTAFVTLSFIVYRFWSAHKEHLHKKKMWAIEELNADLNRKK